MREFTFQMQPFAFLNLLEINVDKRPNQHPTAVISGYIDGENNTDIAQCSAGQRFTLTACGEDGEEKTVFNGTVDRVELRVENGLRRLTVTSAADTVQMDLVRRTRTFQDGAMTYSKLMDTLEQDDNSFGFLCPGVGSQKLNRILVQYEETDWEFCKRVAGRLGTVVIPNSILGSPYISVGVPSGGQKYTVAPTDYVIRKDTGEYIACAKNGARGISERDAISYEFESREIYELCDQITLDNRQLYVYSAVTRLENAELIHTYTLREKSGFFGREYWNEKLVGASLSGTVKSVQDTSVRVSVKGDKKQSKYRWFPYATAFSSPDGTGWYFMPEEGDEVRLYFPTQREEDAYVISSVHITHGDREDPDTKFIRTSAGKEIVFKPDSILITNGAGSSITLDDETGVSIETSKKMRISAGDSITISGSGAVTVRGGKCVNVEQNDSIIEIGENIAISSGHTRMR